MSRILKSPWAALLHWPLRLRAGIPCDAFGWKLHLNSWNYGGGHAIWEPGDDVRNHGKGDYEHDYASTSRKQVANSSIMEDNAQLHMLSVKLAMLEQQSELDRLAQKQLEEKLRAKIYPLASASFNEGFSIFLYNFLFSTFLWFLVTIILKINSISKVAYFL